MNQGIYGFPGPLVPQSAINSVQTQSSATSLILTSASSGYQSLSFTTLGKSVYLPPATSYQVGGPIFIIKNSGGYPFGVRDNIGNLITNIAVGGIAYFTLESNTTIAGTWNVEGNNLEPGLITIDNTLSNSYSYINSSPFISLDNNTFIIFAYLSSGFAAIVVDSVGNVLSSPVTVSSTALATPCSAFKINNTQGIVFIQPNNSSALTSAVVLTVSGASPSLSLSVGTPAPITFTTVEAHVANANGAPKIAQLSPSTYIISGARNATPVIAVIALTVSGTTITVGTQTTIATTNAADLSTTTYALTPTTACILYKIGAAAPYTNFGVVISVSGTTCTVGTPASLTNCTSSQSIPPSSCQLSATKILVADDNNTTQVTAITLTISGTSITVGANLDVETSLATNLVEYITDSATRFNPHLYPLSVNTALFWYKSIGSSRVVILSETAGVLTAGNILFGSFSNGISNATKFGVIASQGSTEFLGIQQFGITDSWTNVFIPHKITGTNITYGNTSQISGILPNTLATSLPSSRLSSGDYIVIGTYNFSMPVIRTNGDYINNRGDIKLPILIGSINQPNSVVSSNKVILTGNDGNGRLRIIFIEIAI